MVHVWFPFITGFLPSGTHLKLSLLVSNTTHLFLYLTCQFSCQAEVNHNLSVSLSLSLAHWRCKCVLASAHLSCNFCVFFSVQSLALTLSLCLCNKGQIFPCTTYTPIVYLEADKLSLLFQAQSSHSTNIQDLHCCTKSQNLQFFKSLKTSLVFANNIFRLFQTLDLFLFLFFFFFLEFSVPREKKFILSTYKKVMYIIGEEDQQVSRLFLFFFFQTPDFQTAQKT